MRRVISKGHICTLPKREVSRLAFERALTSTARGECTKLDVIKANFRFRFTKESYFESHLQINRRRMFKKTAEKHSGCKA